MRSSMRPDKAHYPSIVRFTTPGVHSIDLTRYVIAGYTQMYSLVVGGAGGASNGLSVSAGGIAYASDPAGGGGGQSRYRVHSLSSLLSDPYLALTVGAAGVKGARGGSGSHGGGSQIVSDTLGVVNSAAFGWGADIGIFTSEGNDQHWSSGGGKGGGSIGEPGEPGAGGFNSFWTEGSGFYGSPELAQNGTWTTTGLTLPDLGVGIGGGGGAGRMHRSGTGGYTRAVQNGKNGAGTSGDQYSPGGSLSGNSGGGGGGINEKFLTGVDQHWGSNHGAANTKPQGAVILKFV